MIPVVFCIDVEPDERVPAPGTPMHWEGWAATHAIFGALRTRLRAANGRPARFNWFLRIDPQIAALHGDAAYIAKRDRARIAALAAEGDTIGLHPHLFRQDPGGDWFVDYGDRPWIRRVFVEATDAFRNAFGRAPEAIRVGDAWTSEATVALLASLGFRYDLTLEPGREPQSWRDAIPNARGEFPSLETVPREPYRPARADYRRPGGVFARRLWAIPVSMIPLAGGAEGEVTALNMVLAWPPGVLDRLLTARAAPFLVTVFRSGDLAQERWRDGFVRNLETLLAHDRAGDFAFVTPAELVAWYRSRRMSKANTL